MRRVRLTVRHVSVYSWQTHACACVCYMDSQGGVGNMFSFLKDLFSLLKDL